MINYSIEDSQLARQNIKKDMYASGICFLIVFVLIMSDAKHFWLPAIPFAILTGWYNGILFHPSLYLREAYILRRENEIIKKKASI